MMKYNYNRHGTTVSANGILVCFTTGWLLGNPNMAEKYFKTNLGVSLGMENLPEFSWWEVGQRKTEFVRLTWWQDLRCWNSRSWLECISCMSQIQISCIGMNVSYIIAKFILLPSLLISCHLYTINSPIKSWKFLVNGDWTSLCHINVKRLTWFDRGKLLLAK